MRDRLTPFGLVFLGGALGTLLRYLVGQAGLDADWFPWSTFVVNILGSFLLGALLAVPVPLHAGRAAARSTRLEQARLLVGTGILGGFTTYSAFALELAEMALPAHEGAPGPAGLVWSATYAAVTLVGGVGAAGAGWWAGGRWVGGTGWLTSPSH